MKATQRRFQFTRLFVTIVFLVPAVAPVLAGQPGPCDWTDEQAHKMHWAQLPDLSLAGLDVGMVATALADDFRCMASGPIAGIHLWGSFARDVVPADGPGSLTFELSIYSDVAADNATPTATASSGLTATAASETIDVQVGTDFVIELEYQIAPYVWLLVDPLPAWLELVSSERIPGPCPPGHVGCPGTERWTLRAHGEGDATITLEYRSIANPSEPAAAQQTYRIIAWPAGGHKPGELLWTRRFTPGEYSVRAIPQGSWYDPTTGIYQPGAQRQTYQYSFCPVAPFAQEEGTVYWLAVTEIRPARANYTFAWKTTTAALRWNSSASYLDAATLQWAAMAYPPGHTYEGEGLDLAFVVTGTDGDPGTAEYDWGDAPDGPTEPGYPTLLSHNGARHRTGGPWLGDNSDKPDIELDGQPDNTARGDDNNGNNDENGVAICRLTQGQITSVAVEIGGGGGVLQAWIDFDGDRTWQASEQVFDGFLPNGAHAIEVLTPEDATAGQSFARFRVSTQGGLGPAGPAPDGEVEDYEVHIDALPLKTKSSQWPDLTASAVNIRLDSSDGNVRALTDDWLCDSYNQITALQLWGSWKDDKKGTIKGIRVRIHWDDPVGSQGTDRQNTFPKPRTEILWEKDFGPGTFDETLYCTMPDGGAWWDPVTQTLAASGATQLWRIEIPVDIRKAFLQEGWPQSPRTYWLAVELDAEGGAFGWRTCQAPDRSGGEALWDVGDKLPRPWKQLPGSQNAPSYGPDTGSANMALSFTYSRARTPSEQRDDPLNLYEAVFLYIINHSWSSAPYTYYLSFAGDDPPDGFLEDFPYFDVQPDSAMPENELFVIPRRSLLLYVYPDTQTWIDENTVEIRGAYFCGSLCAAGYRYRLHWDGNIWQVVSETLVWIS